MEIKKWYTICGYILICKKNGICYPIDIQNDKLVIFEPIYIEMPNQLKATLVKYTVDFFYTRKPLDISLFSRFGT